MLKHITNLLRYCNEHNIKIIAYSPLQSGVLTEKFKPNKLNLNDKRLSRTQIFSTNNLLKYEAFINKIKPIALNRNIPIPTLAISWILQHKFIGHLILGASTTEQIEENIQSLEIELSKDELSLIFKHVTRTFGQKL